MSMKALLKTIIVTLFVSVLSMTSSAQGGDFPPQPPKENQVSLTFAWQQVGERCDGCKSIMVSVHSEAKADEEGRYWSYVYAMSNSTDSLGVPVESVIIKPALYGTDRLGNRKFNPISIREGVVAGPPTKNFNGWNLVFTVWSTAADEKYVFEFESID